MLQLSNILRFYDNAEDVIAAFQAKGSADGTFLKPNYLILVTILSEVQPMITCSAPKGTI